MEDQARLGAPSAGQVTALFAANVIFEMLSLVTLARQASAAQP